MIYQNRCDPTLRIYLLALATSRVLASFASLFDLFFDLVFSGCRFPDQLCTIPISAHYFG